MLHWDLVLWGLVDHRAGCLANRIYQDMQLSKMSTLVCVYPKFMYIVSQASDKHPSDHTCSFWLTLVCQNTHHPCEVSW